MRRFFISPHDNLQDIITLAQNDARHIRSVLRLKAGGTIELGDGAGKIYRAVIVKSSHRDGVQVKIVHSADSSAIRSQVALAVAVVKEKAMSTVVKTASQLGIDTLYPFTCERSQHGKEEVRVVRWRTIARESAKQCRRSTLLHITDVMTFENILFHAAQYDCACIADSYDQQAVALYHFLKQADIKAQRVMGFVGPEGGFTQQEIAHTQRFRLVPIRLAPFILTTETAVAFLGSILMYEKVLY